MTDFFLLVASSGVLFTVRHRKTLNVAKTSLRLQHGTIARSINLVHSWSPQDNNSVKTPF